MIAAPHLEDIISFFAAISEEAEGQIDGPLPVVWKIVSVACETSRRRRVGEVPMVLADLSWAHLVYFRRATASRPPAGVALLALTHEDTAVRPMPGPAREAADEWVTEQLSDATFLQYATAEELQEDFPEDAEPPEEEDTVESLRARIRQMESAQGAMSGAVPEAGATLSAEDWQELRDVAGSPPTRLAGHERAPRATAADNALAEEELEVSDMYAERKIPMKELKTVQIFTHFLAHQWEDYRRQGDQLGEAWAARGLVMAEQLAIDQGRTQLGLLLSGLPDIDVSHLPARRTDVRPYGRLSAANWMAAQVAFLKDVDYLESRMKQSRPSGHQDAPPDKSDDPEDKQPNKSRRPLRRAKAIADKPGDKSEK